MADEKKADDEMIAGLKERLPNASDEDIHTVAEYTQWTDLKSE
ncbi:hypothetical protein [Candidatus Arsenophonus triatominarum]|nr:hypothetical protein [Candidatus Arsenophonus triatominarum]